MHHSTTIKVRGYHCDFYGHVNNARYLEFLEEARWSYLEDGLDLDHWQKRGLGFVVVSITIDYRRAVGPNTVLEIRYAGNRNKQTWYAPNLNSINIVENKWIDEFRNAQAPINRDLLC